MKSDKQIWRAWGLTMWRVLCGLFVVFFSVVASANNGHVAVAFPVSNIVVDGRLDDWPDEAPTYPLRRNHYGDWPQNDADMNAWFKVGYDRDFHRLFVLVHVEDDCHVLSSLDNVERGKSVDGAGVHIAFAHGPNGQPVHNAKAIQGTFMPAGQHVKTDVTRTEDSHTYEWSFDLGPYRQGAEDKPYTIPFSVYATDRDDDGSISQRFWSPDAWKINNANRSGDLILNTNPAQMGDVRGQILDLTTSTHQNPANPFGATLVRYTSTTNKGLVVDVMSNTRGEFELRLPAGVYERSVRDWDDNVRAIQSIEVFANAPTVDMVATPPRTFQPPVKPLPSYGRSPVYSRAGATPVDAPSTTQMVLGSGSSLPIRTPTITRVKDLRTDGATSYTASRFSTSNGLPNGFNRDVVVDKRGETWVSNEFGLLRLNSTEAVTYRKRDGLPSDVISCLYIQKSDLWVGTANGAAIIDTRTLEVTLLPETSGKLVFGIGAMHDGRVGICTGRGLIGVNPNNLAVEHYGRPEGLQEVRVLSCCVDPSGSFTWIGTDDGVSHFDGKRFTQNLTVQDGLPDCRVWKIFNDGSGLWFGANRSLFFYDGESFRTIHSSNHDSYQHCDGITQDANGVVWVATWIDDGTKIQRCLIAFSSPTPDGILYKIPIDALRVHGDRFGNLWVAGGGFVSRLDLWQTRLNLGEVTAIAVSNSDRAQGRNEFFGNSKDVTKVIDSLHLLKLRPTNGRVKPGDFTSHRLEKLDERDVWFAANVDLSWYLFHSNETLQSWEKFNLDERVTALLTHATREEAVWVGTRNAGLKLLAQGEFLELPNGMPRQTTVLDILRIRRSSSSGKSKRGDIWCATPEGIYVIRDEQVLRMFSAASEEGEAIRYETLVQLHSGRIVCGTYSGVLILDPDDGRQLKKIDQNTGLPDNATPCVAVTSNNEIWIATKEGLYSFHETTGRLEPIKIPDLPQIAISQIKVDEHSGHVWVVSPQGVTKINRKGKVLHTTIRPMGTSPSELFHTLAFDSKYIWAGSTRGLVRTQQTTGRPEIVFDYAETDCDADAQSNLRCTTDLGSIRFHYHAHSGTASQSDYTYLYRLCDRENTVHWTATTDRSVKIETPPPGEYAFEVLALDQTLTHSAPCRVGLIVTTPYLRLARTFLAFASTVACVLFGIFYVVNGRKARVELEKRVESRTEEILAVQQEKQQLREELLHSQKMESLGTMAAGVAHDFNNALSAIVCNAELGLLSVDDREEVTSALKLVMSASEQASHITRSLLAFAGNGSTQFKSVALHDVIESSIQLIRSAIPAAIEITLDIPRSPIWVDADAHQLQQVFVNLCFNARDAMPNGGTITIALARKSSDDLLGLIATKTASVPTITESQTDHALLSVSDNGPGMQPEVADRVFEPFFTTKARGKGTGLGLSLAHSIITAHGGTISATTQVGAGSTFEIRLPVCSEKPVIESPSVMSRSLQILRGAKVLIADDQQRVRDALAKLLRSASAEVTVAENGEDLIREVSTANDYSLVIADIDMPKVSGLDATNQLRELDPKLPVLLITGLPTSLPEDIDDHRTSFLRKPFRRDALLAAAARLARESDSADG